MVQTTGHTLETNCRLHLQMVCVNSRVPNATAQRKALIGICVFFCADCPAAHTVVQQTSRTEVSVAATRRDILRCKYRLEMSPTKLLIGLFLFCVLLLYVCYCVTNTNNTIETHSVLLLCDCLAADAHIDCTSDNPEMRATHFSSFTGSNSLL